MDITGIDLVGPLHELNGMKYIVTSVDYFSKFVEAKVILNKSGLEITRFIYSLFSRYGVCDVCISDNGDFLNLSILKFGNKFRVCSHQVERVVHAGINLQSVSLNRS